MRALPAQLALAALTALFVVCTATPIASAEGKRVYYRYVDAKGGMHIVQNLNQVPPRYRNQIDEMAVEGKPEWTKATASKPNLRPRSEFAAQPKPRKQPRASDGDVVLYWARWCGYCKKAQKWLDQRSIDYEIRDIDNGYSDELKRLTGRRSIPVLTVDGHTVRGYSPSKYQKLLGG